MSAPNLLDAVETIAREAVNTVAKRRGESMRFKVSRAFSDNASYRVKVTPVRPVARLAAFYELFAEAEEEIQQHHAGLRVVLVPENAVSKQVSRRVSGAKASGRAGSKPIRVRSRGSR
ncbi:hypothetical protein LBMAG48_29160 [Phycisphaerae bacterium]|nr:hypothetical protein LBMAG48_29160 [Phycisphaerae bacterium]